MMRLVYGLVLLVLLLVTQACDQQVSRYALPEVLPFGESNQQNAIDVLEKAISANPAVAANYYRKSVLHFNLQQYEAAAATIRQAIALDQTKAEYHYLLARIARKQGNDTEAYREATIAESYRYPFIDLQIFIADLFTERGNYQQALNYVDRVLEQEQSIESMLIKAKSLIGLSDTLQGEKWLRLAWGSDSTHLPSLTFLSAYHLQLGLADSALYFNQLALQQAPQDPALLLQQVGLLQVLNQSAPLIPLLEQLGQQQGWYDTATQLQLQQYYQRYQYDSVALLATEVLAKDSTRVYPRLYQARVSARKGANWTAINLYKEVLARDSTHAIANKELADLRRKIAYLRKQEEEELKNNQILSIPLRKKN